MHLPLLYYTVVLLIEVVLHLEDDFHLVLVVLHLLVVLSFSVVHKVHAYLISMLGNVATTLRSCFAENSRVQL